MAPTWTTRGSAGEVLAAGLSKVPRTLDIPWTETTDTNDTRWARTQLGPFTLHAWPDRWFAAMGQQDNYFQDDGFANSLEDAKEKCVTAVLHLAYDILGDAGKGLSR